MNPGVRVWRPILAAIVVMGGAWCGTSASAGFSYTDGHGDLAISYVPGSSVFDLHLLLDSGAFVDGIELTDRTKFGLGEITVVVPGPLAPLPPGSEWNFVGTGEGQPVWIIPEVQIPGIPWLGFETNELTRGEWVDDPSGITWTLASIVSAPPGGEISLWTSDDLPNVLLSTTDNDLSFDMITQAHAHANWGFTKPGIYQLELVASGVHRDYGAVSGSGIVTFNVVGAEVPEPGSLTMAGILCATFGVGAVWRRHRRKTAQERSSFAV